MILEVFSSLNDCMILAHSPYCFLALHGDKKGGREQSRWGNRRTPPKGTLAQPRARACSTFFTKVSRSSGAERQLAFLYD